MLVPLPTPPVEAITPGRMLVVSISGLQPSDYLPSPGAPAPMRQLAGLAEAGVAAESVETVTPAVVYPSHATLMTGQYPDRHGVVADRLLGDRGVRPVPPRHASRLKSTTLWQVAREANLQVVSLGWPSTLGASITLLLPEVEPVRTDETWTKLLAGATTPWLFEQVTVASAQPDAATPGWPTPRQRDALMVDIACEVARAPNPPQLWLLRLSQARSALNASGPWADSSRIALQRTDGLLGRLLHCLGESGLLESTAVVVVGDGPALPIHTRVDPNVALARGGLIKGTGAGVRRWTAMARSNGGSAFVYAKSEADAVAARGLLSEEGERTKAFHVVSASELQLLHADPQAWFGLEANPGYGFANASRGPVTRASRARSTGGYLQSAEGSGFVAWGPGFRRGLRIPTMRQVDVAPTIARILGLALPDADGMPVLGLLGPDATAPSE